MCWKATNPVGQLIHAFQLYVSICSQVRRVVTYDCGLRSALLENEFRKFRRKVGRIPELGQLPVLSKQLAKLVNRHPFSLALLFVVLVGSSSESLKLFRQLFLLLLELLQDCKGTGIKFRCRTAIIRRYTARAAHLSASKVGRSETNLLFSFRRIEKMSQDKPFVTLVSRGGQYSIPFWITHKLR